MGETTKIKNIFNLAYKNKHRGNDDGFGYVNLTTNGVVKTTLTFDEIMKDEISTKRDDKKKKKFGKRLKVMQKELEKETDFMLFHHRKASAGWVSLRNTHPINIRKGIFYFQNGTIDGYDLMKRYLTIFNGVKFKSETDTELCSLFVEHFIRNKVSLDEIYEKINYLFGYFGFGVIVRVDKKKKEMLIFKDIMRTLYVYKMKDGTYLMISEPLFEINEFEKCYRLDKGVFLLNKDGFRAVKGKIKDITKRLKEYIKKSHDKQFSCDSCKGKGETIRIEDVTKDFCLSCLMGSVDVEALAKKKESKNNNIKHYDGLENFYNQYDCYKEYIM